jgi:16S rRNA (guanine527-N7)-methyltransferase
MVIDDESRAMDGRPAVAAAEHEATQSEATQSEATQSEATHSESSESESTGPEARREPVVLEPAPEPPPAAVSYFGERLPQMVRLAELLAGDAVLRGLIGPRETPRLWDRHILNCAVLGELLPDGATLVDVGSGAGLPGLVLACSRPDLNVVLVEPLLRRTAFLNEAVDALGLSGRVDVVRGKMDDPVIRRRVSPASWITARAVAPLDRLSAWCAPVMRPGGRLLAMKGSQAQAEVESALKGLRKLRLDFVGIQHCGVGVVDPATTVVVLEKHG